MKSSRELRERICEKIDEQRARIQALTQEILNRPELGFKEFATAALVADELARLGLEVRTGLARTGVKAWHPSTPARPSVAVMGELDALPIPSHVHADPSGAAHACGHHAQIGMLLAAAIGLTESGASLDLGGRVIFIAAPAEENVELEWRQSLRTAGEIEFLGGKQELIRLGAFDDVDMAMLTHSSSNPEPLSLGITSNGHLAKSVRYIGRSAHAGTAPHMGINALKAANLALAAIDAQRDTFRDDDYVRVHAIVTHGGEVVNVVPGEARLEIGVRARSLEALLETNARVERALLAGAIALGARVHTSTFPGYLPLESDPTLSRLFGENAARLVGPASIGRARHQGFTTDVGDVSQLLPTLQAAAGGGVGRTHGPDFEIADFETGVLLPAKAMAMTVIDLLADDGALARSVVDTARPRLTKAEYLRHLREMVSVTWRGEGDAADASSVLSPASQLQRANV